MHRSSARETRRRSSRWRRTVGCGLLAAAAAGQLSAQTDVEELGRALGGARPPAGYYEMLRRVPRAFQFSADNGWILRSHAMATLRSLQRAQIAALAAADLPLRSPEGAVAGLVRMPVLLALYKNTDSLSILQNLPRDSLERRLYGTHAAPPYSVHSYYRELSNDRLDVMGTVLPWTRVAQPDTIYEGGTGCQGLCSSARIPLLIQDLVQAHDGSVDFGQFDNDGPDGVPNSGDDDGRVDAVVIIHPEVDGSCRAVNPVAEESIWAHRFSYAGWTGTTLATGDAAAGGGVIRVNDYIIQGGQGGDGVPAGRGGCESNRPQSMGVVAHETGHLFDLPDLYDTRGGTAGIGRWGIMGSGNQQMPYRPVHMEAWSRARLGWVTEVVVARDTVLSVSPVETSDTAFVVPIANADEYFLVENRQRIGSDSLVIEPGLLIWHIDTALVNSREPGNTVNGFLPHGVSLEQADGEGHLQLTANGNRGDHADPFPGTLGRTAFGPLTMPSTARNDGTPSYVSIDSIAVEPATGAARARLRFLAPSRIAASDTMAEFRLDGETHQVFNGLLPSGSVHTLEMDSVQVVNTGGNRYTWVSWSNGQPRSHAFTASPTGDTIIATVETEYLLKATAVGVGGAVTSDPPQDLAAGAFIPAGDTVTVVASVTQSGHIFEGWSGDTTTTADTLVIAFARPYRMTARFAAPLVLSGASPPGAVMGTTYQHQLSVTGGSGFYDWSIVSGRLPEGLVLSFGGVIGGLPSEVGSFPFSVRVTSGTQAVQQAYTLAVSAPALTVQEVLAHLVGSSLTLQPHELVFLDLLGNRNGLFDVGDFLAWVREGGAALTPEAMRRLAELEGRLP